MPETIPNLWPPEFKIDVQTPYTILSVQANLLGKVTRGILEGVVETETSKEKVQHRLVVIAPAYNGYRHTLVVALHDPNFPYPAEVRAQALAKKVDSYGRVMESTGSVNSIATAISALYNTVYPVANDDEEMQSLVKEALQSGESRAVIVSLIAKSNEVSRAPLQTRQSNQGDPNGADPQSDSGNAYPKE